MNDKALFSAVSGRPVEFVNRLTDQIRRNTEVPVTDGVLMFDPGDPAVSDMDAIFVACRNGETESYQDAIDEIGDAAGDDEREFFRQLDQLICDRDEVEIVEEDAEDPDEEDDEEENFEYLQSEDIQSFTGYAVRAEDAAVSGEDLVPLIQKIGIAAVRDLTIELMAICWKLDEDQYEKGLCAIETYYHANGGNRWLRSYISLIPEKQAKSFFESTIPEMAKHIDWDALSETISEDDQEFELTVGVPRFVDEH